MAGRGHTTGVWRRVLVFAIALAAIATVAATTTTRVARGVTTPVPTGSSPYTTYVWGDEFNGAVGTKPDSTKWTIKTGAPWNQGLNTYTNRTANVQMDGAGTLNLIARKETYTGGDGVTRDYTSGAILSKDKYQPTYGHIEARMQVPTGRGFWSAFWMLRYPLGGEIDILENRGQNPSVVHTNLHSLKSDGRPYWASADWTAPVNPTAGFHVYGITWQPGRISWQFDGQQIRSVAPSELPSDYKWLYNDPEWMILNLAVGGTWCLAPNSSTVFPSKMKIDWVHVFQ